MTENINFDHITEYIKSLLDDEKSEILKELREYTRDHYVPIVEKEVAYLLKTILSYKKPKNILEIGTAIGYSAIMFSDYISDGGKIVTLEKEPEMINLAKENIKKAGKENVITIVEGDGKETITTITDKFDFVFMDANKSYYQCYLPYVLNLLNDGGILVADNILFKGMVANDELVPRKKRTIVRNLREFLWTITHHENLTTSIIPIGDGVSVSVYKK